MYARLHFDCAAHTNEDHVQSENISRTYQLTVCDYSTLHYGTGL